MSTSYACVLWFYGPPSQTFSPENHLPEFLGGVAVGCLVLGCAWTVYANVFGASIYPAVSGGNVDVAVVKRAAPVVRNALTVANSTIVMESPPAVATPATVPPGPSLSFDDRFAAAAPQGV